MPYLQISLLSLSYSNQTVYFQLLYIFSIFFHISIIQKNPAKCNTFTGFLYFTIIFSWSANEKAVWSLKCDWKFSLHFALCGSHSVSIKQNPENLAQINHKPGKKAIWNKFEPNRTQNMTHIWLKSIFSSCLDQIIFRQGVSTLKFTDCFVNKVITLYIQELFSSNFWNWLKSSPFNVRFNSSGRFCGLQAKQGIPMEARRSAICTS